MNLEYLVEDNWFLLNRRINQIYHFAKLFADLFVKLAAENSHPRTHRQEMEVARPFRNKNKRVQLRVEKILELTSL